MAAPIVMSDEELYQLTGSWEAAAALRDEQNNALNQYNWAQAAAAPATPAASPTPAEPEAAPTYTAPEDTPTFTEEILSPPTSQEDFLTAISTPVIPDAPADNITSTGGYTKSAVKPTSGGVSSVIEGDDIETQIEQLPEEYASWQTSSVPGYIDLIRKDDGAILDRRKNATFSDLDLVKMGLSFVPGAGQILAAVNIADAVRKGDLTGALIGGTGLVPGMGNVNTALKVGQAVDSGNAIGAITALAGNTDLKKLTGLDSATLG